MLVLYGIWVLYVLLGITWLYYFISKRDEEQSDNMIGSLLIVTMWPFHILYELYKKCKIFLKNGSKTPSKKKR